MAPGADAIPASTVIEMFQTLNKTITDAVNRVHERVDKVESVIKDCQEKRNQFHQNEVPDYNQHIRCAKNKSAGWSRVKQTVAAGTILLIIGQSAFIIYYLHNLIERVPKG